MMDLRHRWPGLALFGLVLALPGAARGAASPPALQVRIDVPEYEGERPLPLRDANTHFHVVLINTRSQPLRLWDERCSWGEQNLRFELTLPDGKRVTVRRTPLEYTKNFPRWLTLAPGDATVREVHPLAPRPGMSWDGFPDVPRNGRLQVKMKAVFEIPADGEGVRYHIWRGRVESPEMEIVLSRP